MATIIYLDVEDEITSAATRIRSASDTRVALVLPFGSRLATSRINFRLLAREAMVNGKRLDLVAPDASARALAASAGLPVFASVVEYEAALEGRDAMPAGPSDAEPSGTTTTGAGAAAAAATGLAAGRAEAAPAAGTGDTARAVSAARPRPPSRDREPAELDDTAPFDDVAPGRPRGEPRVVHAPRRRRIGAGVIAGFGILVLAVGIAGVAAWLLLPSAEITVTPRIEPIGPISLTVRADPEATAVDADLGIIPAQTLTVPVTASAEFPATGKRVVETAAGGGVRWTNCDPSASYTIPRGTTVRTRSGIAFKTDEEVFLPVAELSGTPPNLDVKCQTSEVAVTAVEPGTAGNVDAGTIRVIPARYNRNLLSVTNPAPTSGGTREEFKRVAQKDIDAALEQLGLDIQEQFATALEDGAGAPPGTTVFPDTAALGEPAPTVDPATLLDQEVEAFTLGVTATGTVLAVDASPVEAIAEARLQGSVDGGYTLVDDSIEVTVGEGSVVGGVVTFPVDGSAKQVRPVDGEALRRQVLGLGREEAIAALTPYGEVDLVLWPDWVAAVPSLEQRVTLTVGDPVEVPPGEGRVPSG
ncbi:MAG: baseplate J/gp47 family protein [Chloroflexota bacterium]